MAFLTTTVKGWFEEASDDFAGSCISPSGNQETGNTRAA